MPLKNGAYLVAAKRAHPAEQSRLPSVAAQLIEHLCKRDLHDVLSEIRIACQAVHRETEQARKVDCEKAAKSGDLRVPCRLPDSALRAAYLLIPVLITAL